MALLPPQANMNITQPFGPSDLTAEPAMFADKTRANWQAGQGFKFFPHFHSALDISGAPGIEIFASEGGEVVFAGRQPDRNLKVEVQIRPNVFYSSNHCRDLFVERGDTVVRGQTIAEVGSSGNAFGAHNHFWVGIGEISNGVLRLNYHNPALFLPGGAQASSPLIASPDADLFVQLNGPGINIRTAPSLELDSVFATSTPAGIVRNGGVIARLDRRLRFMRWVNGDGLIWAKVRLSGANRFIWKQLIHFVE
jgi:murein DD-endopeptidase MepM/ murein hydrolase activator NlpD